MASIDAQPTAFTTNTSCGLGSSTDLQHVVCNYSAIDAAQTFVVPAGVSSVDFSVAAGMSGYLQQGGAPGLGGSVAGTLAVTAGTSVAVVVGGRGSPTTSAGGYPDGGSGGAGSNPGCGGGGSSSLTIGTKRVVVAGGGGGCGGIAKGTTGTYPDGGWGGGVTGGDGRDRRGTITDPLCPSDKGGPGLGGTATQGGAGGQGGVRFSFGQSGCTPGGTNGGDGVTSGGAGGQAATDTSDPTKFLGGGGGGGGGGWMPGGGGGGGALFSAGAGGGGGSSGWDASVATVSSNLQAQNANAGSVTLSYVRVPSTTTVTALSGTVPHSGRQTLAASVSPAPVDNSTTVAFTVNGTAIACDGGVPPVVGGKASCSFDEATVPGAAEAIGYYSGDDGYQPSQGTADYTVVRAPTGTSIGTVTAPSANSLEFPIVVTPDLPLTDVSGTVSATVTPGGNSCTDLQLPDQGNGAATTVTCRLTGLTAGTTYSIGATYSGSTLVAPSTSATKQASTPKQTSTTALTIVPNAGTFGDQTTVTGVVTADGAQAVTGTLAVYRVPAAHTAADPLGANATSVCSGALALVNGKATYSCTLTPTGGDSYYVAAYAGDATSMSSRSASATYNAAAASTSTTLTVTGATPSGSFYTSTYGDPVTFDATTRFTSALSGAAAPAAPTTILDGSTVLCTSVPCTVSTLSVGKHDTITASYAGDASALASASAPTTVTVVSADATVTLANSGHQPAGRPVTLTATLKTVSTTAGGGTVTFYDRAKPAVALCSVTLPASRTATCSTTPAPGATISYQASYVDAVTGTVVSNISAYTSDPAGTTTTVSAGPTGGAAFGAPLTLTATVTSTTTSPRATPDGTVTFRAGATTLCSAVSAVASSTPGVATAQCTSSTLHAGAATVTASYSATAATAASSGTANITITGALTVTTVSTVNAQSGVTASVTVRAGGVVPTGSVTVRSGTTTGTVRCTVAALDANGSGSCSFALPSAGTYTYVAVFTSSSNDFAASHGSVDDVIGAADQPCTGGFNDLWNKAKANPTLNVVGSAVGSLGLTVPGSLGTCNQAASLPFTASASLFGASLTGSGLSGVVTQSGGLCLTAGTVGLPAAYHAGALTIVSPICFDIAPQALLSTLRGGSMAAGTNATTPFFTVPGIGTVGLTLTAGHSSAGAPTLTIATTVSGSSVSATMSATIAGDGSVSGTLTTSGLTVFDQPLALGGAFSRTPSGAVTSQITAALDGPFTLVTGVTMHDLTATLGTDGLAMTGKADLGSGDDPIEISVSGAFTSLRTWTLQVTGEGTAWTPVSGLTFTPSFDGTITSTAGKIDYDVTAAGPEGKGLATWTPGAGVQIVVDSITLSNGDTDCGSADPVLTMAGAVTAGPVDAAVAGCVNLRSREFTLTATSHSLPIASGLSLTDFTATIQRSGGGVSFHGTATGSVDVGGKTLTAPFTVQLTSDGDTIIGAGVDLTPLGLPVSKGYLAYASKPQDTFDTGVPDLTGGAVISLPAGLSARGVLTVTPAVAATLSQGGFAPGGNAQIAFEASLSKTAGITFHGELSGPDSMPFLTLPGGSTLDSATLDYADGTFDIDVAASIANDSGDPAAAELAVSVSKDGSFTGSASVTGLIVLGQSVDLTGTVTKPAGGKVVAAVSATVPGPITIGSSVPVALSDISVTIDASGLTFAGHVSVADSAELDVEGTFSSMRRWTLRIDGDSGSWSPTDGVTLSAHLSGTLVHNAGAGVGNPTTTVHLAATGSGGGPLFSITPTDSVTLAVNSIEIGNDAAPSQCPSNTTTGDLYLAIDAGLTFELGSDSGEATGDGCFDITRKSFEFTAGVPSLSVSALGGTVHIDDLTVSIGRELDGTTSVFTASAEGRLSVNMPFGGQVTLTAQMVLSGGNFAIGASADLSKYLGARAASGYLYYANGPITVTVPNPTIGKVKLAAGVTVAVGITLSADQSALLAKIGLDASSGVKLAAIGTIDFAAKVVALNVKLDLGVDGQTIFGSKSNYPNAAYMSFLSGSLQVTISPTSFSIGVRADVMLYLPAATPGGAPSSVQLTGMFAVSNTGITVSLSVERWLDAFGTAGLNLRYLTVQGGVSFTGLPSFGFAASVDGLPTNVANAIGYTQGAPITIALNLSVDQFLLKLEIGTKNSGITAIAPLTAVGKPDLIKVDYALLYISPAGATIGTQVFSPGFEIALQATILGVKVDIDAKIDPVHLSIYFKADIGKITIGALTIGPTSVLLDASVKPARFTFQFSGAVTLGPGSADIGPALKISGYAHADVTVKIATSGFSVSGNFDLKVATSMLLPQDVCWVYLVIPTPCDYQWEDQAPLEVHLDGLGFGVDDTGVTLFVPNTTYSLTLPFPGYSTSTYRSNASGFNRYAATTKKPTQAINNAPLTAGHWAQSGALGTGRAFAVSATLPNGAGFVAGGVSRAQVLASAETYDPSTGRWTTVAAMPHGVATASTVTLADGRVLVIGGADPGGAVTTTQAYDPTSGAWSVLAPMHVARQAATATVLSDGTVLVAGGRTRSGGITASAETYDPSTNTWTTTGGMPGARALASSVRLGDGTVLVAGGIDTRPLATAAVYSPATRSWTRVGGLTTARFGATALAIGSGSALVAGGAATAEIYHAATHRFTAAGLQSASLQFGSAVRMADGRVLSVGGLAPAGPVSTSQVYSPGTNSWAPSRSLPGARGAASALVLGTGNVLVTGGTSTGGVRTAARNDTEVFALPTGQHVPDGGSSGPLANTGVKASPPAWVLIGSLLIMLGALLVLGGRRRRTRY